MIDTKHTINLNQPITNLLPKHTGKALALHNILSIADVLNYTKQDLLSLPYIGKETVFWLEQGLELNSLYLKQ